MDLLSLTSITVILILIVGGYLVFTEQVSGRPKLIMIAFLGILAIMLLTSLNIFKSYYEVIDSPTPANNAVTISGDKLKSVAQNKSFSISTWIYIQDWNYGFGTTKNILTYNQPGSSNPVSFDLDTFENNLIISYNTYTTNNAVSSTDTTLTTKTITVQNINIQKWVNIVCCFSTNKVDTYINGKLVDTTVNQYPLYLPSTTGTSGSMITGNNGGYSGSISNTRFYSKFLSPSDVWDIYKAGYSTNLLGNFLNRYQASFTFYQDNNQVAQYTF